MVIEFGDRLIKLTGETEAAILKCVSNPGERMDVYHLHFEILYFYMRILSAILNNFNGVNGINEVMRNIQVYTFFEISAILLGDYNEQDKIRIDEDLFNKYATRSREYNAYYNKSPLRHEHNFINVFAERYTEILMNITECDQKDEMTLIATIHKEIDDPFDELPINSILSVFIVQ